MLLTHRLDSKICCVRCASSVDRKCLETKKQKHQVWVNRRRHAVYEEKPCYNNDEQTDHYAPSHRGLLQIWPIKKKTFVVLSNKRRIRKIVFDRNVCSWRVNIIFDRSIKIRIVRFFGFYFYLQSTNVRYYDAGKTVVCVSLARGTKVWGEETRGGNRKARTHTRSNDILMRNTHTRIKYYKYECIKNIFRRYLVLFFFFTSLSFSGTFFFL